MMPRRVRISVAVSAVGFIIAAGGAAADLLVFYVLGCTVFALALLSFMDNEGADW